eukprot:scaffold73176_cov41-Attheya_sp.AAC.1
MDDKHCQHMNPASSAPRYSKKECHQRFISLHLHDIHALPPAPIDSMVWQTNTIQGGLLAHAIQRPHANQ